MASSSLASGNGEQALRDAKSSRRRSADVATAAATATTTAETREPEQDHRDGGAHRSEGAYAESRKAPSVDTDSEDPPLPGGSNPLRCYRLNLERPFDIHAEESPLEYGDYMTPWTEETLPDCARVRGGPVEYQRALHMDSIYLKMCQSHDSWAEGGDVCCDPARDEGEDGEHLKLRRQNNNPDGASTKKEREGEGKHTHQAEARANETARLFRRSELSIYEAAEKERRANEARDTKKKEEEQAARQRAAAEKGKKIKKKSKNILRRLSLMMSERNGRQNHSSLKPPPRNNLTSFQSSVIEKARDFVDEPEYADGDENKPPNLASLYIVGEYDMLNDLIKDGAKRLADVKDHPEANNNLEENNAPYPEINIVASALARAAKAAAERRAAAEANKASPPPPLVATIPTPGGGGHDGSPSVDEGKEGDLDDVAGRTKISVTTPTITEAEPRESRDNNKQSKKKFSFRKSIKV